MTTMPQKLLVKEEHTPYAGGEHESNAPGPGRRPEGEEKHGDHDTCPVAVLRSIGEAVLATDDQGRVVLANPAAEALAGWKPGTTLDQDSARILRFVAEGTWATIESPIDRVLRGELVDDSGLDVLLRVRGRAEIPIEYTATPLIDNHGRVTGAVLVLRERARRLVQSQTLQEVTAAATSTLMLDEVLERACRALAGRTQAEFLGFFLPCQDGQSLQLHPTQICCPHPGEAMRLPEDGGASSPPAWRGGGVIERVYRTGEPATIGDVGETAGYCALDAEARSALAIPLRAGTRIAGVLVLESRRPCAFAEGDVAFFSAIAGQVGLALHNAHLYQETCRQAEEAQAARARLLTLDRHRGEYMQNLSHELRTPLSLILGYAQWLADEELGELPAEQRQMASLIVRQARLLNTLAEDIALTWLAGARPVRHQPVALDDLVRTAVEDFAMAAGRAGLHLTADVEPGLPPVLGNPTDLRRVLDNLLGNALKFTPAGGTISLQLRRQENWLVLRVSDTGIGIPPNQQPHIFDRFYQVDGTGAQERGGVGLGLALVKEIVQAHGGQVTVDSSPGCGSVFTITLPAVK